MTNVELPDWVDPRLQFHSTERAGAHYLLGNPHTFRGLIGAWHEDGYSVNVSRSEIVDPSATVLVWIDGYLAGSEPPPPATDSLADEEAWDVVRKNYRATGAVEYIEVPDIEFPDERVTTVDALMRNFHSGLVALVPAADVALMGWRDDYQHPSWEALSQTVFDSFVAHLIHTSDGHPWGMYALATYDVDASSYAESSWIGVRGLEKKFAFVRFSSPFATHFSPAFAFDSVELVEVGPENLQAGCTQHLTVDEVEFVLVKRDKSGTLSIVEDVRVSD